MLSPIVRIRRRGSGSFPTPASNATWAFAGRFPGLVAGLALALSVVAAETPGDTPPLAAAAARAAHARKADPRLEHGRPDPTAHEVFVDPEFDRVTVYSPPGPARGLLLFASGDGGWNLGVRDMAREAAGTGLWVAGFDTPEWLKRLDAADAACSDVAGLLHALGLRVLAREKLPPQTPLLLGGYSSGATVVYAALVEAPPGMFAGGVSLGFCPDLIIHRKFCPGANGLTDHRDPKPPHTPNFDAAAAIGAPWRVLQGEIDQVCAPHFAIDFARPLPQAKTWMLPLVGHGFGKPRHWLPQYLEALRSLPAR